MEPTDIRRAAQAAGLETALGFFPEALARALQAVDELRALLGTVGDPAVAPPVAVPPT